MILAFVGIPCCEPTAHSVTGTPKTRELRTHAGAGAALNMMVLSGWSGYENSGVTPTSLYRKWCPTVHMVCALAVLTTRSASR